MTLGESQALAEIGDVLGRRIDGYLDALDALAEIDAIIEEAGYSGGLDTLRFAAREDTTTISSR